MLLEPGRTAVPAPPAAGLCLRLTVALLVPHGLLLIGLCPAWHARADMGVPAEAVAEAYDAFERGEVTSPLSAAAVSNQTIQESMRLLLMVRGFQVMGHFAGAAADDCRSASSARACRSAAAVGAAAACACLQAPACRPAYSQQATTRRCPVVPASQAGPAGH